MASIGYVVVHPSRIAREGLKLDVPVFQWSAVSCAGRLCAPTFRTWLCAAFPQGRLMHEAFSPTQVAAIRRQLLAANTRLVAIKRERRELKERIAALAEQLERDER
jgi:hypothetical protein